MCITGSRPCSGCLETIATDSALAVAASRKLGHPVEFEEVVTLVQAGQLEIDSEIERFLEYLSLGLSMVINLFNPEVLFIYGGFLGLRDDIFSRLVELTGERSLKPLFRDCRIQRIDRKLREGSVAAIVQLLTGQYPFKML